MAAHGLESQTRNVQAQLDDPSSILTLYRQLIATRATLPALQIGTFELHPAPTTNIVAHTGSTGEQTILMVLNLGRDAWTWQLPEAPGGGGWPPPPDAARIGTTNRQPRCRHSQSGARGGANPGGRALTTREAPLLRWRPLKFTHFRGATRCRSIS
jgi:hypothetical protein